ncbi:MAG TPA: hypothetical protein VF030_03260 [Solirubrobacterales bacterium]
MAVMMPRERWSDDRLDEAFHRVDSDIRELRMEMKNGFERVDKKFDALQSEMNGRFDTMQRTMFIGFVTLFVSIVASLFAA